MTEAELRDEMETIIFDERRYAVADQASRSADAILSLLRESGVDLEGWRPIESAPRDGTVIMLFDSREQVGIGIGAFCDYKQKVWELVDENTQKLIRVEDKSFWNGSNGESVGLADDAITHWRPLPDPPKKEVAA